MAHSAFNTESQQNDLTGKIVAGLERISEAFRVLLWEHAKHIGLSPIQIQILIFIRYHKADLCTVSYLAREFNLTKPTISDAVKALGSKGLISKHTGTTDSRSYTIGLSPQGMVLLQTVENFALPIGQRLAALERGEQEHLFRTIAKLIYELNQAGIISVQRTCFGCSYYQFTESGHYCRLLQSHLAESALRLDCPEYTEAGG